MFHQMKNGKMRYAYEDDSHTVPKSGGIVEELLLKEKNGKGSVWMLSAVQLDCEYVVFIRKNETLGRTDAECCVACQ